MGITNLPKMLKKYAPKQKLESLVSYSPGGNVLGIDMSTAIVAAARSQRGAEEYHQRAPVPAHHVAAQCLRLINKLTKLGFAVYPVFDGLTRTPLKKSKAAKVRDKPIEKHYNALRELLGTPWPRRKDAQVELLKKITQARKGSAKADASVVATLVNVFEENGIDFIFAPFEADWQLAYLYNIGAIHGIVTTDSDYWALLQNPCLILELSTTNMKAHICFGQQCLLKGARYEDLVSVRETEIEDTDISPLQSLVGNETYSPMRGNCDDDNIPPSKQAKEMPIGTPPLSINDSDRVSKEPHHHLTRVGAIIRATVYGCDYHSGTKNIGVGTLEPLMKRFANNELDLIDHLKSKYPDFLEGYKKLTNIYHHSSNVLSTSESLPSPSDKSISHSCSTHSSSSSSSAYSSSSSLLPVKQSGSSTSSASLSNKDVLISMFHGPLPSPTTTSDSSTSVLLLASSLVDQSDRFIGTYISSLLSLLPYQCTSPFSVTRESINGVNAQTKPAHDDHVIHLNAEAFILDERCALLRALLLRKEWQRKSFPSHCDPTRSSRFS